MKKCLKIAFMICITCLLGVVMVGCGRECIVTYENWDGTSLQQYFVKAGDKMPEYSLAQPTREADQEFYYEFIGWDNSDITKVKNDVVRTAQFRAVKKEYTITFMDGNQVFKTHTYKYGEQYDYVPGPEKYRQEFIGWSNYEGSSYPSWKQGKLTCYEDKTWYACFEPTHYQVIYNATTNGGTLKTATGYEQTADVEKNTAIDFDQFHRYGEKEGYEFVGWNTDKNAREGLDELTMPKSNVTLYAIYRKPLVVKVHNVTNDDLTIYYYNNETSAELIGPSENKLEDRGFELYGWSLSEDSTSLYMSAGYSLYITEAVELYAIYRKNIVVRYNRTNADGGDVENYASVKLYNYYDGTNRYSKEETYVFAVAKDEPLEASNDVVIKCFNVLNTIQLAKNKLTREHYTVDGWIGYSNSQVLTLYEDLILEPNWVANTYQITYLNQWGEVFGGTHEEGYPTTHAYNQKTTLKSASLDGHTFMGWYLSEGAVYGEPVTNLEANSHGPTIKLYAKMIPNQSTITFDWNGVASIDYTLDSTDVLPSATRDYYDFVAWIVDASAGNWQKDQLYYEGFSIEGKYGNVTLVPTWTLKQYKITYMDMGQEVKTINPKTYTYLSYDHMPEYNIKRPGLVWQGWEVKEITGGWGKTVYIINDAAVPLTFYHKHGDITLHAYYTSLTYDIIYKDEGGKTFTGSFALSYPIEHAYDQAVELVPALDKAGYTFGGWYYSQDCEGSPITSIPASIYASDVTLYAKWEPKTFAIEYYDSKSGNEIVGLDETLFPITHVYGQTINLNEISEAYYEQILQKEKDHYTFSGWRLGSASGSTIDQLRFHGPDEGVIKLYATWELRYFSIKFMNGDQLYRDYSRSYLSYYDAPLEFPTKQGYAFIGWSSSNNNIPEWTNIISDSQQCLGDKVWYACFEKDE